jgi:hypothetical protein
VLLDAAVVPLASGLSALGASMRWRIGPANRDVADPACVEFTSTPGAKPLQPFSPVRARAARTDDGVVFSFLRRGRVDADAWEPLDIPLSEDSERYEIEVLRDGAPVRVLSGTTPSLFYATADQIADFGAPPAVFDLRIYQLSAAVGRGFPLAVSLAAP